MAIRDRLNRLISRKSFSLSSGSGSGSGSGSTTGDETSPPPSGAVTPLSSSAPSPSPVVAIGGEPLSKASSRLGKTLTWRSNRSTNSTNTDGSNSSSNSTRPAKPAKQPKSILKNKNCVNRIHPSERPLTEANLRQQELLSAFTMTFGRRQSAGAWSSYSGVSPCCSRLPSFDAGVVHVKDRSGDSS